MTPLLIYHIKMNKRVEIQFLFSRSLFFTKKNNNNNKGRLKKKKKFKWDRKMIQSQLEGIFLKIGNKRKNYIFLFSKLDKNMSYLLEMPAQPSHMIGQSQTSVCACTSTNELLSKKKKKSTNEQMQESEWAVVGI